jgi:hypothetical protein
MPGVKASEGSTGFYVRGGGPDQNLILLDGVPVYNAAHLFGFFSVFNTDAINHVELIKGGFPARYGGRLSSVLDIRMKEGNMSEMKAEASVSTISAKATVEGPIKKNKSSFILSSRRTYVDLVAKPLLKRAFDGAPGSYFFYDLNAKVNYIINDRNRVYLSVYGGDDRARSRTKEVRAESGITMETRSAYDLSWGNRVAALRWNKILGPKLFGNLIATYSRYAFSTFRSQSEKSTPPPENYLGDVLYEEENISSIRDWASRLEFDFTPSPNHNVRFGASSIWHRFAPGVYRYASAQQQYTPQIGENSIDGIEFSGYLEDEIRVTDWLKLNAGVHASGFKVDQQLYRSVQPRLSSRALIGRNFSLKSSFTTMTQFIHLLTNAGLGLPTDLWVPATTRVKPQQAWQAAIGVAKTYQDQLEFSVETYYKKLTNLIEYKDGASFTDQKSNWQDKVATKGVGESYGTEFLCQKKQGNMTGWVGYTLSWANRKFEEINQGKWYPYKYDRRHDISVALTQKWSDCMNLSLAWVFGTGNHITVPTAQYGFGSIGNYSYFGGPARNYPSRNNYEMRAYHRLDVAVSFTKKKKHGQRKWTVGAYNAYSRRNPYYITLGYDQTNNPRALETSLFPIIPSVAYSFKFK